MEENKEQILYYDANTNKLYFYWPKGRDVPYPCSPKLIAGKIAAVFSARYPMSLVGTRVFKSLYPKGKATQGAVDLVKQAKETEQSVKDCSLVASMEKNFRVEPYSHQREAIEHMLHFKRLALLLEQGLGKTYISLMATDCFRSMGLPYKSLVVCPNIVFPCWLNDAAKFTDLKFLPYKGTPSERTLQREMINTGEWDCVLTTFDMLLDKPRTSQTVYADLWMEIGKYRQQEYAVLWLQNGLITNVQFSILLNPKNTKSWPCTCAKIMASLPHSYLPLKEYVDAVKDSSNIGFLKELPFSNLIVDEASRCLDHQSQRSQAVNSLAKKADRAYLLSGTLCVGRPTDMFMPMNILGHDILGMDWTKFVKSFCRTARSNSHIITGYKNLAALKRRIDPHVLAKTRIECLDLPKRVFVKRYYELSKEMRRLYNQIAENDLVKIGGNTIAAPSPLIKIAKCLQVLNGFVYYNDTGEYCNSCEHLLECVEKGIRQGGKGCKIPDVPKAQRETWRLKTNPKLELLLEDLRDSSLEKTIIWAWYQEDLLAIRELLTREKIRFITADTENSAGRFEADNNIRVFLGQTSQGIGITLNSATCTIYFSHGTALEPRLQSMDRNYRIGQTRPVIVKDYLSKGTVEESLVNLLEHKTDVKKFMQARVQCFTCENLADCQRRNIPYLGQGCAWYGERMSAEKIKHLKLKTVTG